MDSTSDTLFWCKDVADWPALFGGDGDDGGDVDVDSEEDSDGDEDSDLDDSDRDGDGDDEDRDEDDEDEDEDEDGESSAAYRRLERQNRRLQQDLDEAMELLEEAGDRERELDTDEERTAEVVSLRQENEDLRAILNGQYVKNAIGSMKNRDGSPKYDWIDIEDVFNALDADDIDIDIETGEIDGLEDQLADIASRKPHWLRSKRRTERKRESSGSSGSGPSGSGRRSGHSKTREEWGSTYNILTR